MTDLIERQDAIDAVMFEPRYSDKIARIKNLPAAEPERKNGRWIRKNDGHFLQCEFCNRVIREPFGYKFKFCPNCGADMREDDERPD